MLGLDPSIHGAIAALLKDWALGVKPEGDNRAAVRSERLPIRL
jgi:hypothetical protein